MNNYFRKMSSLVWISLKCETIRIEISPASHHSLMSSCFQISTTWTMICFSRPFSRAGCIGFRFSRQVNVVCHLRYRPFTMYVSTIPHFQTTFVRWKSETLKFDKIDRHSYLTQKQKKKLPEFLAVATLVRFNRCSTFLGELQFSISYSSFSHGTILCV